MIYITTTLDQRRNCMWNRTNYGKFSLKAKGTKIWNDLPDDVKKSNSYSIFKTKMKMIASIVNKFN